MNVKQTLLSSIGQKLLLAISGLIMFLLFLIPHMGGNVLFLFGPDIFNSYAHHLHQLVPVVIGIEVLMLVSITVHMIMAFRVVLANRAPALARTGGTVVVKPGSSRVFQFHRPARRVPSCRSFPHTT